MLDYTHVYDIETYLNAAMVGFRSVDTGHESVFSLVTPYGELDLSLDQSAEMAEFLRTNVTSLAGFNSRFFDDPILCFMMAIADAPYREESMAIVADKIAKLEGQARSRYTAKRIEELKKVHFILSRLATKPLTPDRVAKLAQAIIYERNTDSLRWLNHLTPLWESVDLRQIGGFFRTNHKLKHLAIAVEAPHIEELPFNPHRPLGSYEEIDKLRQYLSYDLDDTLRLYRHPTMHGAIGLRRELGAERGMTLTYHSDTGVGKAAIRAALGRPDVTETPRSTVIVADIISPKIQFKHPVLKRLRERLARMTIDLVVDTSRGKPKEMWLFNPHTDRRTLADMYEKNVKDKPFKFDPASIDSNDLETFGEGAFEHVKLDGITYNLGVGGLHSIIQRVWLRGDDNNILVDGDVTSFYPFIMLLLNMIPEHLPQLREVLEEWVLLRVKAKRDGDTLKAQDLKITINSIFGLLLSKFFMLYDPKAFFGVTINGQLLLLHWIDMLLDRGIKVISANTDGVMVSLRPDQVGAYKEVCEEWMAIHGFELEWSQYSFVAHRDINNYLAIELQPEQCITDLRMSNKGKVKTKGAFSPEVDLKKGYMHPVVPEAVYANLVHGVPVETYINGCDNPHKFVMTQRVGNAFELRLDRIENGRIITEYFGQVARWVIAKKGMNAPGTGSLKKVRTDNKKETAVQRGQTVAVVNYIPEDQDRWGRILSVLDKDYYIAAANKLIASAQPSRQLSLF